MESIFNSRARIGSMKKLPLTGFGKTFNGINWVVGFNSVFDRKASLL
jgi:hypothetical protein